MDQAIKRQKEGGKVRVGRRIYQGSKFTDPSYSGFTNILCLTKSSPYGDLSPYVLTNKRDQLLENAYQFVKLYDGNCLQYTD